MLFCSTPKANTFKEKGEGQQVSSITIAYTTVKAFDRQICNSHPCNYETTTQVPI